MKPFAFALSIAVFVVLASLTMHVWNGFLHTIVGGGPNGVLRPLDLWTDGLIAIAGFEVVIACFSLVTGLSTGLAYWVAAMPAQKMVSSQAAKPAPDAKAATAPRDRARTLKPRKAEQPTINPNRVAHVMGLRGGGNDGRFTA